MLNPEKDQAAQDALLDAIAKDAQSSGNSARMLRDLAEAYALVTGKVTDVQHVDVKSG
jgi:hypothetical protein